MKPSNDLTADDPLFLLAKRTFATQLDVLQAQFDHERSPNAAQVHEARIAIRRIRVGLKSFDDLLPVPPRDFRGEFGSLGRALGAVREVDVLAESVPIETVDSSLRAHLEQSIGGARDGTCRLLDEFLAASRFRRLLPAFSEYVAVQPSSGVQRRWRSLRIRDAARADARASLKSALKRGRRISAETPADPLHRLRIRMKHLRYESELYSDFDPALRYLARGAKGVQEVLGAYRDAHHAAAWLRRFGEAGAKEDVDRLAAVAPLIRQQQERAAAARRAFPAAWRRFERLAARSKRSHGG